MAKYIFIGRKNNSYARSASSLRGTKKMPNFDKIIAIAEKDAKKKKLRHGSISALRKAYKVPDWFKGIKPSTGHGSGVTQQRAWAVVSEYVRKRDFKRYGGKCVSCWRRLDRWQEGQAAHYKPWSICHGMYKFDPENIHLSCPFCNFIAGGDVGHAFGEELKRRSGFSDILQIIDHTNEAHRGQKCEDWMLVELVARLAPHLVK